MLPIKTDKYYDTHPMYLSEVPPEFYDLHNQYTKIAGEWFFDGLYPKRLQEKEGINRKDALNHVRLVLTNLELDHDYKIADAACLIAQWFNLVETT